MLQNVTFFKLAFLRVLMIFRWLCSEILITKNEFKTHLINRNFAGIPEKFNADFRKIFNNFQVCA